MSVWRRRNFSVNGVILKNLLPAYKIFLAETTVKITRIEYDLTFGKWLQGSPWRTPIISWVLAIVKEDQEPSQITWDDISPQDSIEFGHLYKPENAVIDHGNCICVQYYSFSTVTEPLTSGAFHTRREINKNIILDQGDTIWLVAADRYESEFYAAITGQIYCSGYSQINQTIIRP